MTIEELVGDAQWKAELDLQALQEKANAVLARMEEEIDSIFSRNGVTRCPKCAGTGALERLDAGYMKKFGLQEWDGCKNCGGDGKEQRGRGYLKLPD